MVEKPDKKELLNIRITLSYEVFHFVLDQLKKPSLCTGNTHISEDSSEIVFLLVEI